MVGAVLCTVFLAADKPKSRRNVELQPVFSQCGQELVESSTAVLSVFTLGVTLLVCVCVWERHTRIERLCCQALQCVLHFFLHFALFYCIILCCLIKVYIYILCWYIFHLLNLISVLVCAEPLLWIVFLFCQAEIKCIFIPLSQMHFPMLTLCELSPRHYFFFPLLMLHFCSFCLFQKFFPSRLIYFLDSAPVLLIVQQLY